MNHEAHEGHKEQKLPAATDICRDEPIGFECETFDGTPSREELAILCRLVVERRPGNLFEFGTFRGQTARLFSRYAGPYAKVYTLDLPRRGPRGALPAEFHDGKYVEQERSIDFSDSPGVAQLWGDSALVDLTLYGGMFDFVFVDGSHSFENCLNDSLRALAISRRGGVIAWHDYGTPHWPGVTAALNGLRANSKAFAGLKHVAGTSLAILERER